MSEVKKYNFNKVVNKSLDKSLDKSLNNSLDKISDNSINKWSEIKQITIPSEISGTYITDYNIINVHDIIIAVFEQKRLNIPVLQQNIVALESEFNDFMTVVERQTYIKNIDAIRNSINGISVDRECYLKDAIPLLEKYRKFTPLVSSLNFKSSKTIDIERIDLIDKYLDIAGKYHPVNVVRTISQGIVCYCGIPYSKLTITNGNYYCNICTFELAVADEIDDNLIVGTASKSRDNFIKAIQQYQGKITLKCFDRVKENLDRYFKSVNVPTSEKAALLPYDKKEPRQKENTSVDIMITGLRSTQQTEYYPYLNYLLINYWNWKDDNISHLESKILEEYDNFQRWYQTVKKRKASINVYYLLYRLLERLEHPVKSKYFKMPTGHSLDDLEDYWRKYCEEKYKITPPTIN